MNHYRGIIQAIFLFMDDILPPGGLPLANVLSGSISPQHIIQSICKPGWKYFLLSREIKRNSLEDFWFGLRKRWQCGRSKHTGDVLYLLNVSFLSLQELLEPISLYNTPTCPWGIVGNKHFYDLVNSIKLGSSGCVITKSFMIRHSGYQGSVANQLFV